jgi:hypothetical protein
MIKIEQKFLVLLFSSTVFASRQLEIAFHYVVRLQVDHEIKRLGLGWCFYDTVRRDYLPVNNGSDGCALLFADIRRCP